MKYVLRKKGVNADLFKWIFALVAGALIFVFLMRFGFQHVGVSESLNEIQLVEYFNDHLDAFGGADMSSKEIKLYDEAELFFSCEVVGSKDYGREFNKLIFAPTIMKGETIEAWTMMWNFPFPIASMFYLGNDKHRTIVVYDSYTEDIVESLDVPFFMDVRFVRKEVFNVAEIQQYSGTLYVVILARMDTSSLLQQFKKSNVYLATVDVDTHSVYLVNSNRESFYVGDEMLYGLFFDPEKYSCVVDAALKRLGKVSMVYSQKAGMLMRKTDSDVCSSHLYELSNTLASFAQQKDVGRLYDDSVMIKEQNKWLERNNCPRVF